MTDSATDKTFNIIVEALKNVLSRQIDAGWATVPRGTGTKQLSLSSLVMENGTL